MFKWCCCIFFPASAPCILFFFLLILCQNLHVHLCRPPAAFAQFTAYQDGPFLRLEEGSWILANHPGFLDSSLQNCIPQVLQGRFLKRPESAVLNSRAVILLYIFLASCCLRKIRVSLKMIPKPVLWDGVDKGLTLHTWPSLPYVKCECPLSPCLHFCHL